MDKKTKGLLEEFQNGTCLLAHELLGCHRVTRQGMAGYVFRVWAPNACTVSVVGEFNDWNIEDLPMEQLSGGVWEAFTNRGQEGCQYQFYITRQDGSGVYKADPYATRSAVPPNPVSCICTAEKFPWTDGKWMRDFPMHSPMAAPMNIYELHLGTWRRKEDGSFYTYSELAEPLVEYLVDMGYTHIELMPLGEYLREESLGYETMSFFAPTARYGKPQDLKKLVDTLHRAGIGVILDWVPSRFPEEAAGLMEFDGTCCYEPSDEEARSHPADHSRCFDYSRNEVRSFLVSNVVYWLEKFHIDGLRVEGVDSMLYLDYHRPNYRPNRFGGRENLDAMDLLRRVNRAAQQVRPNAIMVAEMTQTFPTVTKPECDGGMGFLFKWNTGWMQDVLNNFSPQCDNLQKRTDAMENAYAENFVLPLSHYEVVQGNASLLNKMPGDYDVRFSGLRAFLGFAMAHPGKKLLFMGNEFAHFDPWNPQKPLDWVLLDFERHRQMQSFVREVNHFYRNRPPFWQKEQEKGGFKWTVCEKQEPPLFAFRRIDNRSREVLVVCNFSTNSYPECRFGVPRRGIYKPVLSSDEERFGGSGMELPMAASQSISCGTYKLSALFCVPAMSVTYYVRENPPKKGS